MGPVLETARKRGQRTWSVRRRKVFICKCHTGTCLLYLICLLAICLQKPNVLDATRTSDGSRVVLKRVAAAGNEIRIAQYLSSDEMRSNPRNRTVPIIDVISLPNNKEVVLLVMPYLRVFNTPPFHCRAEFVDSLRQLMQVCKSCYAY
jgi:hypothetical protein